MVYVKLEGINVRTQILKDMNSMIAELKTSSKPDKTKLNSAISKLIEFTRQFTPEIISAAYARISRSPKNVNELVREAALDVPKARDSNRNIIYGMGHHSVADHAIFNFNITHVSRLAVEGIEKRRIGVGYTEKSQRYITLEGDFVKPKEFSPKDLRTYKSLVISQNQFYSRNNERLFEHLQKKYADKIAKMNDEEKKVFLNALRGSAKEDARFALSLGTEAQLGCSYNGEALEHAIRTLKYSRLMEEREIAVQLFDATIPYAPSLIQLTDPEVFRQHNPGEELIDDNFKYTEKNLRDIVKKAFNKYKEELRPLERIANCFAINEYVSASRNGNVTLVKCNNIDMNIIAALLHEYSKENIQRCYELAYTLIDNDEARDFIRGALKYLSAFDKVPRAFEMSGGLIYEAVISSSGFAQLKRHRMMTLLSQDYNPKLGFTIPPNIEEAGIAPQLTDVVNRSSDVFYELEPKYGKAAEYCLTNAHGRRTLIGINMRELYHVSRTREDKHAQWEIRGIASSMARLAKEEAPLTTILLGGQDQFQKVREYVYAKKK